jgi:hypothetical protein
MKDKIKCFIIFTIDKYGIFHIIIIRQNISSRKIISSWTIYLLSFRTKMVLIRAKQYISFKMKIITIKCFVRDKRDSMIRNISSGCDMIFPIFSTRKFYETRYLIFHSVIIQHIKNPCVLCPSKDVFTSKASTNLNSLCATMAQNDLFEPLNLHGIQFLSLVNLSRNGIK